MEWRIGAYSFSHYYNLGLRFEGLWSIEPITVLHPFGNRVFARSVYIFFCASACFAYVDAKANIIVMQ